MTAVSVKLKTYKQKTWLMCGIFILVSAINVLLILCHENWQDEAQAWMIARDVRLDNLIETLSFEGHPILWFLVLMPFARLGFPYFTLNIISFVIMEAALALLLLRSPFSTLFKVLISLSPLFVYYLPVISRSHSLVALFIILLAILYDKRDKRPILYGLCLALLLQTHMLAAGLVIILCLFMLKDTLMLFKKESINEKELYVNLVGLALPVFSGILLVFEFSKVMNAGSLGSYTDNISRIISIVIALLSILACVIVSKKLKDINIRRPVIIAIVSVAWQIVLYLTAFNLFLQQRIILILYMMMFSLWIVLKAKNELNESNLYKALLSVVIAAAVCVSGGYYFIIRDVIAPYSFSKEAAEYINENLGPDDIIFINSDTICVDTLPYLNKDITVYNPFHLLSYDPVRFSEASFVYRGKHKTALNIAQFKNGVKNMFPDADSIYVLYCINSDIYGMDESNSKYEILFDTFDKDVIVSSESFRVIQLDISDVAIEQ